MRIWKAVFFAAGLMVCVFAGNHAIAATINSNTVTARAFNESINLTSLGDTDWFWFIDSDDTSGEGVIRPDTMSGGAGFTVVDTYIGTDDEKGNQSGINKSASAFLDFGSPGSTFDPTWTNGTVNPGPITIAGTENGRLSFTDGAGGSLSFTVQAQSVQNHVVTVYGQMESSTTNTVTGSLAGNNSNAVSSTYFSYTVNFTPAFVGETLPLSLTSSNDRFHINGATMSQTPEPSGICLISLALLGLGRMLRCRRRFSP